MKLIKYNLAFSLLILTGSCLAQWSAIPSGTNHHLKDVHFPDASMGYAVGSNGVVLKTTDAGDTWQTVYSDSGLTFRSVFFTSHDTGYAAGGSLYKTTNGGLNWSPVLSDSLNIITEVYFLNSSTGFVSGTKLYRTTDAGISWDSVNLNNTFSTICFPSDSVGYFIGGPDYNNPLYKTTDGGQTYIPITNGLQSIKESAMFLNDSVGYMCGWYSPIVVKTTNGGFSWYQIDTINPSQCWEIYFQDENNGYYFDNSGGTYKILHTTNGGATWTGQLTGSGAWLNALQFIDPVTAIAVGDSGKIYKTTNGGVGIQENDVPLSIRVYPNPFSDFTIINSQIDFENATATIYNQLGQSVYQLKHLSGNTNYLYRNNLPVGMYFLHITEGTMITMAQKLLITD